MGVCLAVVVGRVSYLGRHSMQVGRDILRRRKLILLTVGIACAILAGDALKSYVVAKRYVQREYPTGSNLRFGKLRFVGIWKVEFLLDAWHDDAWIQVSVPPVWPGAIGHKTCR